MMYAVILAGGSGTRLWPLSRELFPKQYLSLPIKSDNLPETAEGEEEQASLFINTVRRVLPVVKGAEKIIVVTHKDQAGEIERQLRAAQITGVRLIEEPEARNTAPAIGTAAWQIAKEAGEKAVMAVLPSDHLIGDREAFVALLKEARETALEYGLVTFGIRPTYPETGYGYICAGTWLAGAARQVDEFVEKPDLEKASTYLKDERYLWNSGMFVFKVGALKEAFKEHLPKMHLLLEDLSIEDEEGFALTYGQMEKISIDYGILEKAKDVAVLPAVLNWSDLGSWESYHQVALKDSENNFIQGRVLNFETEGCLIYGGERVIGAIGLKDLVIVDSPDALLVCPRSESQEVRQVVEKLQSEEAVEAREHLTNYRPWGSYTTLELGETYQVKRINVNPGARLSLQSHKHRAENWIVVEGEALVTIDEREIVVKKGESAYIPRQARHRMENKGSTPLVLIEVQNGDYLGEDDIIRYEDDYGRGSEAGGPNSRTEIVLGKEEEGSAQEGAASAGQKSDGKAAVRLAYWLSQPSLDEETRREIEVLKGDPKAVENHFGRELVFGTGGMRGLIGPGVNRINCYTIRRVAQGMAAYINKQPTDAEGLAAGPKKVAIAYDTRHQSEEFALAAALVLAANGIKALLFDTINTTPLLSFATRTLGCAAGIVITASHNPPGYNGFKVYGPDGGQAVSPLVDDIISEVGSLDLFRDVKVISKEEALEKGLLELLDKKVDEDYLEQVKALSLSSPDTCLKVVYTPLHGTGVVHIPGLLESLKCLELHQVKEQLSADPDFSTVRVPNPEDPAALSMALKLAQEVEADLVLATDPDADRVGVAVREKSGRYTILNGNQVGALLIECICRHLSEKKAMPLSPVLVKTIVTGDLGSRVARSYGLKVEETLTGFKFIGEKIKDYLKSGTLDFVFGYEESCGFLTGTFVRDKDAAISSYLIAEMTAFYKEEGKTLPEVLGELQKRHGYFAEELLTIELKDILEAGPFVAAFENLPEIFAGQRVAIKKDYAQGQGFNFEEGTEFSLELPRSEVLHYTLADGSWFAVRPSGTEPKVKFYLSVCAATKEEAAAKLKVLRQAVQAVG